MATQLLKAANFATNFFSFLKRIIGVMFYLEKGEEGTLNVKPHISYYLYLQCDTPVKRVSLNKKQNANKSMKRSTRK